MKYFTILDHIHVFYHDIDRQKVEMEAILTTGGSWFEESADRGKKHLLEHCILSQTHNKSFRELKDYVFRENIYLNAYTGTTVMGFEASGYKGDAQKILDLLTEFALDPHFNQSDLDREKEVVLREISERRGDPQYRLYYDVQKELYTDDSQEVHEVLGDADLVAQTTLDDFMSLHTQNLSTGHIIFMVSGGGCTEEMLKKAIIERITSSAYSDIIQSTDTRKPITFVPKSELKQSVGYQPIVHELAHEHAELTVLLPATVTLQTRPVLSYITNLFFKYGGVLYDRLRDELQLVYGISTQYSHTMQILQIQMACEVEYIPQIISEITDVLTHFDTYFDVQKYEDFKNIISKKEQMAQDTLNAPANHAYNVFRAYGEFETMKEYANLVETVTVDDVKEVFEYTANHIKEMKVVAVSKNPEIHSVKLSK